MNETTPLLLFDGVCNLCCFWIQFVIRRDPKKRFRFAALQSSTGQQTLKRLGLRADSLTTMILVEGNRHDVKSSAALRIARRLGGLWPLLSIFIVIPAPLRDSAYDLVARNRYRWFGKRDRCLIPAADIQERFLT